MHEYLKEGVYVNNMNIFLSMNTQHVAASSFYEQDNVDSCKVILF